MVLTSDVLKEDIYNIFRKIENRPVYTEMWISCKKRPQAKNPVYCHNQKSSETKAILGTVLVVSERAQSIVWHSVPDLSGV